MNQIKIEDGCELPKVKEPVVVFCYLEICGRKDYRYEITHMYVPHWKDEPIWDCECGSSYNRVVTHWCKLDIPEDKQCEIAAQRFTHELLWM